MHPVKYSYLVSVGVFFRFKFNHFFNMSQMNFIFTYLPPIGIPTRRHNCNKIGSSPSIIPIVKARSIYSKSTLKSVCHKWIIKIMYVNYYFLLILSTTEIESFIG